MEFVHPEDRAKVDAAFAASLEKRTPATVKYRIVLAGGRVKVLEEHWKVLQEEQGRPVRLIGTCQDVTERERLRDELQRERDRLRLLLDLNHHFIPKLETRDFFDAVSACLRRIEGWEGAAILLPEPSANELRIYLLEGGDLWVGSDPPVKVGTLIPLEGTISGKVYKSGQPAIYRYDEHAAEYASEWYQGILTAKLKLGCALPLIQDGRVLGVLVLSTRQDQQAATHDCRANRRPQAAPWKKLSASP